MSDFDSPEINSETEPSNPYFKLVLQFEKHSSDYWKITDQPKDLEIYQALVDREVELMKQVFIPGQKNIFLREAAKPNYEYRDLFMHNYSLTHSAQVAHTYASFLHFFKREPKEGELEVTGNYIFDHLKDHEYYNWALMKAVDLLNKDDYQIDFIFETYTEGSYLEGKNRSEVLDAITNKVIARDDTISDQIMGISQIAERDKKKTNMLAILGLLHNELIETLPDSIIKNTFAVTEYDQKRTHPELISIVDQEIRLQRQKIKKN